ncbi:non-homologous end-joining DNA ligase [Saccharopolyspora thermophila]|nr:non-homologous end-joining DNA ligase [Saccharopolyspora subtropica]
MPGWLRRGPMLPTAGPPPVGSGWAVEIKWDGVRVLVVSGPVGLRVISRNGRDMTSSFPELAALTEVLGGRRAVLDGEIVVLGSGGQPDFSRLQARVHRDRPTTALLRDVPVRLYAFDLLHLDGVDLLAEPYVDRRDHLDAVGLEHGPVHVPDCYTDIPPVKMLAVAREHHLEGIVAKRLTSRYAPGTRSPEWIKTTIRRSTEVTVGGWVPGTGAHRHVLGALLVGVRDDRGRLRYAGHVGTGFAERDRAVFAAGLDELARTTSPFTDPVPPEFAAAARWVEPLVVAEVEFREWTAGGHLRHPSFRRIVVPS